MDNLQKTEMTYQEYNDFFPLADELVHYFEQMADQDVQITANQVARLINFGAQYGIGSSQFWEFTLDSLDSLYRDLDAPKCLKVMNTLKDIGLLTQSQSYTLSEHLMSMKGMNAEQLSVLLIILQSDDLDYLYKSMGKYD